MINKIEYPERQSEFEIQAKLYAALQELGVDCRGCVPAYCYDEGIYNVFFDLVVFKERQAVLIIECKNRDEESAAVGIGARQRRRYSLFGVELIICDRPSGIEHSVSIALNKLNQPVTTERGPSYPTILQMIDSAKSSRGGYTRQGLAALGVSWPPPKGWKKRLILKAKGNGRPWKWVKPEAVLAHSLG